MEEETDSPWKGVEIEDSIKNSEEMATMLIESCDCLISDQRILLMEEEDRYVRNKIMKRINSFLDKRLVLMKIRDNAPKKKKKL